MRVCLLGNDYTQQFPLVGYGGIEACVENLAYGLSKYKDIDLTVVIPKRQVINNYDATPFKLVETEAIPTALSGHSPNTFCLQAKKIIKDIKPDIIWSQSNWSADILLLFVHFMIVALSKPIGLKNLQILDIDSYLYFSIITGLKSLGKKKLVFSAIAD